MAARAHDVVAMSIKGNLAILNFLELVESLPWPASNLPRDVQATASKELRVLTVTMIRLSLYYLIFFAVGAVDLCLCC